MVATSTPATVTPLANATPSAPATPVTNTPAPTEVADFTGLLAELLGSGIVSVAPASPTAAKPEGTAVEEGDSDNVTDSAVTVEPLSEIELPLITSAAAPIVTVPQQLATQ